MSQVVPVELVKRFCQASAQEFEFIGMIGQGGMGAVLCAHDRGLDRRIAIKLLLGLDARRVARFEREAQITANLDHPGIVRVHSAGVREGIPFIAYELVEGETFEQALLEAERERQVALIAEAARALGHAHEQGVVHRDVKPSNVLVDAEGRVRVADFGLATGRDVERLTQTNAMVGTPGYMAPEQLTGRELGPGVDVWALGVILYECLCGEPPFTGDTLQALMSAVARGNPTKPRAHDRSISTALEQVCLEALQPDPERRYVDGNAFADDLERALGGARVEAGAAGTRGLLVGLLALVLLALAAVALALLFVASEPAAPSQKAASPTPVETGLPLPAEATPTPAPSSAPFQLALVPIPPRPGLTAYSIRSLARVGDDLVTIEDPRTDTSQDGLRVHFAPGVIVRTFDPVTLALRRSVRAHTEGTGYMATAPGLVATGAGGPLVRLWRLPDLSPAGVFPGHAKRTFCLALSPDGSRLVVADNKWLRLWRVSDQTLVWKRRIGRVRSLAFLPNTAGLLALVQRVVPGKKQPPGKKRPPGKKQPPGKKRPPGKKTPQGKKKRWFLERWSLSGKVVAKRPAPVFWKILIHPKGRRALTARWKPGVAWFWKLGPKGGLKLDRRVDLRTSSINGLAIDPAWRTLFLATPDGRHVRFDVRSKQRKTRLVGRAALYDVERDGEWIYSGGSDALVRRMSALIPKELPILAPPTIHEGAVLAVGEKTSLCDFPLHTMIPLAASARPKADRGPRGLASMTPSGRIALAYPDQNADTLVLKTAWQQDGELRTFPGRASALVVGRKMVVAMADGGVYLEPDTFGGEWLTLRDPLVKRGAKVKLRRGTFEPVTPQILALALDPLEKRAFGAGDGRELLVWDLEHPQSQPSYWSGHTPPVLSLAATEWNLFAGERGGAVSVFRGGRRVGVLRGRSPVLALLPLKRGTILFAGSQDGWVRVWDVEKRAVLAEAQLPDQDFARSLGTFHDHVRVGTQLGRIYRLPIPGS